MKNLKLMTVICVITSLLLSTTFVNAATPDKINTDMFLLKNGVPQKIINHMDNDLKNQIIEELSEVDTFEFLSSETKYYKVSDTDENSLLMKSNNIPDSDLELSVTAFTINIGGQEYVDIFPYFEWLTPVKNDNDYFSFNLCDGWKVKGKNDRSIFTYAKDVDGIFYNGDWERISDCGGRPYDSSFTGYSWTSLGVEANGFYSKGHAAFKARKIDENASDLIKISYVHDPGSIDLSYTVTVNAGPFSISINGSDKKKVDQTSDIFELDY